MASPRQYDRIRNFGGGVDMYRPASEIGDNQSSLMQNVVVKDNFACRTRAGFDLAAGVGGTSFSTIVTSPSAVQGMFYYNKASYSKLLVAENGKLYSWDNTNWADLSQTFTNSIVDVSMEQGVDKLMITDGQSYPKFFDGTTFTPYTSADSTFLNGVSILCWSTGRMLASGNPAYPDTIFFSHMLDFAPKSAGTSNWDLSTQSTRIGNGDGQAIVALAAMQNANVAVLKENSVWLLNMTSANTSASNPIANWSAQEQGDLVGSGVGCVGKNAWCVYQNDLLFMSQDGVQSLQRMQAAAGQYQLTSPLSLPIQPLIDRINWSQSQSIKAVKYRNLAIFFVPLDSSTFNNYALVWNGRIAQWTGYWTNVNAESACVTRFNNTVELYVGDGSVNATKGYVNKWKDAVVLEDINTTYQDNGVDIPCELDTRSFIFGNFDANKKMRAALFRFNKGDATVLFNAVFDLADVDDWNNSITGTGDILGTDILPFQLESFSPVQVYRGLEGLGYCNEVYFKISCTAGWFEIRNIMASAFMKSIRDPAA